MNVRPEWYRLVRPLLFALPPEAAHGMAVAALRAYGALPGGVRRQSPVRVAGIDFPSRVGVAAGLDKDAVAVRGLARLGFGFVEVGTVTPRPQPGNAKPRLFRLEEDAALINRMGFNSAGAKRVGARLAKLRPKFAVPVGVNIGKNRDTPLDAAAEDYQAGLVALYDCADYFTVNLSSPNTPGLRDLQSAAAAGSLIEELVAARNAIAAAPHKPIFVKLAPDLAPAEMATTAVAVLEAGADGLVAVNTTVARPTSLRSPHAAEAGGLSGQPLFRQAHDAVRRIRVAIGEGPALIGVGGITNAKDASAMLDAGADLIQVYTALIYRGPALARELSRG